MRRSIILFILTILVPTCLLAQAELKFTRAQRAHLNTYQQISQLVRQGKTNQKRFFEVYYKPIYESNQKMGELNRQEAQKLNGRANKALNDNKPALAERLNEGAKLYQAMSEINKEICKAYEKSSVGSMRKQLDEYLALEIEMTKVGAKPYPREWYTSKEAEQILKQMAQKNKR